MESLSLDHKEQSSSSRSVTKEDGRSEEESVVTNSIDQNVNDSMRIGGNELTKVVGLDSASSKNHETDHTLGVRDDKGILDLAAGAAVAETVEDNLKREVPPAVIAGLLQACGNEITQVEQELKDLTSKQNDMYDKIREHNEKLESNLPLEELSKLFDIMKVGLDKLSLIRQEMHSIHERSARLKARAARLTGLRRSIERTEDELVAQLDVGGEQDSVVEGN